MSNVKISQLPSASTPLTGAELVPVVQSGVTSQTTVRQIMATYIDVSKYATSGVGTTGSPWVGWDTAITWSPNTQYEFPAGYYSYASAPSGWNQDDMILKGTVDTVLRCTGVGPVMYFDAGTSGTIGKTNLDIGPFILEGNGTTTQKGLWLRSVNRSRFDRIRVRGVTQYGIHQNFGVLNEFYMPMISKNMDYTYVMPSTHLCFDSLTSTNTYYSSSSNVYTPVIEGNTSGVGIKLINKTYSTQFFGGTSEGMGTGLEIGNDIYSGANACAFNSFYGLDFEANATYDAYIKNSFFTSFTNCTFFSTVTNNVNIVSGAGFTKFINGQNTNAIYDGGLGTQFDNHAFVAANYSFQGTGDTQWNRCRDFATNKTLNYNPPTIQYTNSVTGTITVATGTDVLILDGTLAGTLTVALPAYIDTAGSGALNPQIFKLCCTGAITTVTFTDPKGRTVPANLTGVTAGSSYTFYYGAAGFKWIRIG